MNRQTIDLLSKLAVKYGTDKCPQIKHSYTPYYYDLFKKRRHKVKKILEIGIGYYNGMLTNEVTFDRTLKRTYHKGASLKMWRDFFPNAIVFGADIRPETMFEDKRIKTYVCDETKKEDLINLIKKVGFDIDILIDDASHHVSHQISTCLTLMPLLNKEVTYVIEDTRHPNIITQTLKDYNCVVANIPQKVREGNLVIVRHKDANSKLKKIYNDFKNIKSQNYHKIWKPFMKKYQCKNVCELGVYKGENFINMIAHKPEVAVAIDTWKDDGVPSHNDAGYTQEELDGQYDYFKNLVSDLKFVQIVKDYTVEAAKKYPDNYFDFVYIDADHSFEGCLGDIISWYPKVKIGKFLVGHDYRRGFGVVKAVNKLVSEKKLKLMFLPPSTWAVVKR